MFGLIAVYILSAIGVVGGLVRPVVGLFVYVGFAMLRPQYMWQFAGDMSGLSQLVGISTLIGWALHGFGGMRLGRGRSVVAALLFFLLWAALSSLAGIDSDRSFVWVVELLKVVGPFLVGATLLDSKKYIWLMLWVIVASHGYIAYDLNSWYYLRGINYVAESGYGYMDNNSFGISLVTALGATGGLVLGSKKWPERILACLCAALILSAIVLTYSRGALLGIGVIGAAALLLVPKRASYIALMLVAALLAVRLVGPQVQARFETVFAEEDDRDASAQSRVQLWRACWNVALDNPLFGIGPRNFPLVASRYGFNAGKEAHSTWMQSLAEMGFPGAGALTLFYLLTIVKLIPMVWRKWTDEYRQESALAAGILMGLIGFFVSAQFVTMIGLEAPYYLAMIGVAMMKTRTERAAIPQLPSAAPTPRHTLPLRQPLRVRR